MSQWGVSDLNTDYKKPRTKVGLVILNGGVNEALCTKARQSASPLYARALGADSNNHHRAETGDIVFTMTRHQASLHALSHDSNNGLNREHHRVFGMTRLNGLGTKGQTNTQFMQQISILGICENSNRSHPKAQFNIIRGGIVTGFNNGNETLYIDDWIMAYAPTREEISQGGKGKEADANGDLTLWYKPYNPHINRITTKSVYQCLKARDKQHMESFVTASEAFLSGAEKMALAIVSAVFDKLPKGASKKDTLKAMEKSFEEVATRNRIIETLFPLYSDSNDNSKWIDPTNLKAPINKKQAEGADEFIAACSYHFHNIVKNMVGKSLSHSRPKTNVDIQVGNYSI